MLAGPVGSHDFAVPYRGGLCPAMPVLWDGCVWGAFLGMGWRWVMRAVIVVRFRFARGGWKAYFERKFCGVLCQLLV